MFKELPRPEDIGDYEPYLTLGPLPTFIASVDLDSIKEDADENDKNIFKF